MAFSSDLDVVTEVRRLGQLVLKNSLKLPAGLTGADLVAEADRGAAQLDEIEADKRALTTKIAAKGKTMESLNEKIKRVRGGIKAEYGDDSTEYESVGGTRASDRKKRASKATQV